MVKLGIIGAGKMGMGLARSMTTGAYQTNMRLSAVCEADPARAKQAGLELDVPSFTSVDDMFQAGVLDAVYIAVPDGLHREPFEAAARQGAAILVEKPFATTVADALAMLEAAKAAGIVAEVNFSNRWNPPFVAAKRSIDAGEIGDIVAFNSRLNNIIESPISRLQWAGQTTPGWFLLSHVCDLAVWLSGKRTESVVANGVKRHLVARGVPTYDYIHAMVRYEDGTDGLYESAWILPDSMPSPVDFKFEIIGSKGAIYIDTHDQMIHRAAQGGAYQHLSTLSWTEVRMRAFAERVKSGDTSLTQLEEGLENTRTLVAMHEALETRSIVSIVRGGAVAR